MSEWKTYKLGDLVTFQRGHDLTKIKNIDGIYPVAGSNGIIGYHNEFTTKAPGITIGRSGNIGSPYYYESNFWAHNTTLYVKEFKNCNPKYIYYLLKTMNFGGHNSGSAVPSLNRNYIHPIEVIVPDLAAQIQIAQILSSLDNKIELNLQINQTLETMVQAIFKEWFVNFNFPGFDGKLVEGLPKGWRMGKVSETCKVNVRTLNAKDEIDEIQYIEISEVDKGVIKNITVYKRGEEPSRAKRKLSHGDVVLSTVRPNRGSYFLSLFPNNNLIASTGFAVFTATLVPYSFLYCFLTNEEQIEYYGRMADGAAYPAINQSVIMNIDLVIPANDVLKLFNDVTGNLYLKIYENLEENKALTQLRDTLLPKLMTGKIEVKA